MTEESTITDLAYIAGLFDGEGCITIGQNLRASVSNTKKPCLEFVQAIFGGSLYEKNRLGRVALYDLYFSGYDAVRMLNAILPYLIVKHQQAELAILFQSFMGSQGNRPTENDLEMRKTLSDIMKSLNKRGVTHG